MKNKGPRVLKPVAGRLLQEFFKSERGRVIRDFGGSPGYQEWLIQKGKILNWAVLSDEQMSNEWPFPLLNDEQMSNKVGVEHQPVKFTWATKQTLVV